MRITIVQGAFLPVPPLRGGAIEKAFYALAQEFASLGHSVFYISRHCDGLPEIEEESPNLKHCRIKGYDAPKSSFIYKFLDFLYSQRVYRNLPHADILVTHTFWLPILARNPLEHGNVYVHVGRVPKGQMRLYQHVARLQTVSSTIVEKIKREVPKTKASKLSLVHYPLSPEFLKEPMASLHKEKVILYAGRIHPEKGIGLLIRAFLSITKEKRLGWHLHILGPWKTQQGGGGEEFLMSLQELSGSNSDIQFQEPIFGQLELISAFDKASIFVYPSLAEKGETFGLSALEAMARRCVTLVSSLSCFKDFVEDGENGYVFNHRGESPEGILSGVLLRLIENIDQLDDIRESARRTALDYSVENISQQFLDDFHQILRNEC